MKRRGGPASLREQAFEELLIRRRKAQHLVVLADALGMSVGTLERWGVADVRAREALAAQPPIVVRWRRKRGWTRPDLIRVA